MRQLMRVIEIPAGTLEKWEVKKDGSKIVQQIENNRIRTDRLFGISFQLWFYSTNSFTE